MAFAFKNLQNNGGSGDAPKLWSYSSSDSLATIKAANYFNSAADLFRVGDRIAVYASDAHEDLVVSAISGGVVTVQAVGELSATATWNPASVASGAQATTTVTVTGAALGDHAIASFSLDLAGAVLNAYVSAANTVTVVLSNMTAGAIDLASGTLSVRVLT